MAAPPSTSPTFPDYTEVTKTFFDPRLIEIGLGEEQIATATVPQLKGALERVNDCIANPQSFGVLRLKLTASGFLVVSTEAHMEVGILPLLLLRKKLILERLSHLAATSGATEEPMAATASADHVDRDKKNVKESEAESEVEKWREQALAADDARRKAQLAQEAELARIEVFERRSRVWQKFLERQSVATIVGAILLIAIFAFIVASSTTGTAVPELISNAFLVILGYFFGQAKSEGGQAETRGRAE